MLILTRAQESTLLSKGFPEILSTLKFLSDSCENKVKSLSEQLEEGDIWMNKIHQVIDVVSQNTPWLTQIREDEEGGKDKSDLNVC